MTSERTTTFPGTRDWFGPQERLRQAVIAVIRNVYEQFGFEPLTTPALEYRDVLFREQSETTREIFEVRVRGRGTDDLTKTPRSKPLGLRFDHTVPLARFVAQYAGEIQLPYKRYAIGPVWRPEKPQAGRYREFTQVDFDTIGSRSLVVDAEVVAVLCSVVNRVGISDYSAVFNSRVLLDAMAKEVGAQGADQVTEVIRSWDKLGKDEFADVPEKLTEVGLDSVSIERFQAITRELQQVEGSNPDRVAGLRELFSAEDALVGLSEIERLLELIEAYGQEISSRVVFTPSLARGFSYYTGPVFEMVTGRSRNSFGGGGRFDNLIEALGGPSLPATGASFGLERFVDLVEQEGSLRAAARSVQVYVTVFGQTGEWQLASVIAAQQIRQLGYSVELAAADESFKRQLAAADRKGAQLAVIIGPDERQRGVMTIKDLRVGFVGESKDKSVNQREVWEGQLPEVLSELLG